MQRLVISEISELNCSKLTKNLINSYILYFNSADTQSWGWKNKPAVSPSCHYSRWKDYTSGYSEWEQHCQHFTTLRFSSHTETVEIRQSVSKSWLNFSWPLDTSRRVPVPSCFPASVALFHEQNGAEADPSPLKTFPVPSRLYLEDHRIKLVIHKL